MNASCNLEQFVLSVKVCIITICHLSCYKYIKYIGILGNTYFSGQDLWKLCIVQSSNRHPKFIDNWEKTWHQFSSVQLLSRVRLFATPWIAAHQASLSITNSRSSLRLAFIESVMPSSHLILGRPLLLLPPILPSIKVFSKFQITTILLFGKIFILLYFIFLFIFLVDEIHINRIGLFEV